MSIFNGFDGFTPPQREDLRQSLLVDDRNNNRNHQESEAEQEEERIDKEIDSIEARRKGTQSGNPIVQYILRILGATYSRYLPWE